MLFAAFRLSPATGTDVRHVASPCNANAKYCFQSVGAYVLENAILWALRCVGLCIATSVVSTMTRFEGNSC